MIFMEKTTLALLLGIGALSGCNSSGTVVTADGGSVGDFESRDGGSAGDFESRDGGTGAKDKDGGGYDAAGDRDGGKSDAHLGAEELCDGMDNDRDGETDEDFPRLGRPCDGNDADQCKNGTFTCRPNGEGERCVNETVTDIEEVLNGQDDDCDGETDEGLAPPEPADVRPCENGSCWNTAMQVAACGRRAIDENFSTGRYNVHKWATTLHAEAPTRITLTRTGGEWKPAIIVIDNEGTVLSDGAVGRLGPGLEVEILEDGTIGAAAQVRITVDDDLPVSVFVTGWEVVQGGFVDFPPADATYSLDIKSLCEEPQVDCVVLGHTVDEPACGWLHHIALEVVPLLSGARAERVTAAARVGWWSLKEGVLFLENPLVFSLCAFTDGQRRIGPLEVCPSGRAWQVGLAGVQVRNYPLSSVEETAAALFPGLSVEEVLEESAINAGLVEGDVQAVAASTGALRESWLLRSSAIGFTHQVVTVTDECIDGSLRWCYSTAWEPSRTFAPDKASAMRAIEDVRTIIDALAP